MPYKDPARQRQWEREHREQRNARRRTRSLTVAPYRSRLETLRPDPIADEEPGASVNMVAVLVVGFTFVLILLFAGWRFRVGPEAVRHA
jgi:hypothetical protein